MFAVTDASTTPLMPSSVDSITPHDLHLDRRLNLLGLPAEIRLRILRKLLVHDGPIEAVSAPEVNEALDGDGVITLDDIKDSRVQQTVQSLSSLHFDCTITRIYTALKAYGLDFRMTDNYLSSLSRFPTRGGRVSYDPRAQVMLSRSILRVSRQLYQEGVAVLYEENRMSWRLTACSRYGSGDVDFSIFDHSKGYEIDLLRARLHPSLFKFTNIHLAINVETNAYPCRTRSMLRCIVSWFNDRRTPVSPRQVVVEYKDMIQGEDIYEFDEDYVYCNRCGDAASPDTCECKRAVREASQTQEEPLTILAPLKHFRNVKSATVLGVSPECAQALSSAMELCDSDKPSDLCGPLVRYISYLEKLPSNCEITRARNKCEEIFELPLQSRTQRKSSDPLLARLAYHEVDDGWAMHADKATPISLVRCPDWIRYELGKLKKAMDFDDVEAFYGLMDEICARVDLLLIKWRDTVLTREEAWVRVNR